MRDYEIVYIFDSTLEESAINERLERYHGLATAAEGAEVTALDHWGKRQLAYPIDDRENGYYVVAQFTASPESLPELERILKLDEPLLRYLIVINEGELKTTPFAIKPPSEEEGEENGEDEDETEEES